VRVLYLAAALTATILGSGCASGAGSAGAGEFDRQFIDMMVPHHQGAIEMARIAQQRSEHPEIKQLAEMIVRSQDDEIGKMKNWRSAWFGSDQTPPMNEMPMVPGMEGAHGGHGGAGTMDMAAEVESLRRTTEPFDRAFVDAMIPHHESAIDAAKAAENRAQRSEIKELARAIIADQQREIDQMMIWRQAWYGSAQHQPVKMR
jgi:uncharacterized protein (DUF305 family)